MAVDVGDISAGSAGQWLSANLLGMVSEYYRRSNTERVRGALQAAITRGVPPHGRVTTGYVRAGDRTFQPDPATAPAVVAAFAMRAAGATVDDVWRHLTANGIDITYGGAYALLSSRVVLGELHFGGFEPNLTAHPPIVDRATWDAVQRVRVPTGRKAKSERILARLGILRCATCGSTARGVHRYRLDVGRRGRRAEVPDLPVRREDVPAARVHLLPPRRGGGRRGCARAPGRPDQHDLGRGGAERRARPPRPGAGRARRRDPDPLGRGRGARGHRTTRDAEARP
jgi:hypothetical protein